MFSFRTTRLEDQLDKALIDGKVACFCTQNCWDTASGRYMYDIFRERGNLVKVFSPSDAELSPDTEHIPFKREDLEGLNAIVVEIQDAGARYFNYTRDVFHLMTVLLEMEDGGDYPMVPSLYVVDHDNPAGRVVEGSMPVVDNEPWVPKIAHRHGLTLGELCHLYYNEIGARFPLHIISARATDTNRVLMPWTIAPASDIPGMFTCYMYSGGGLWNGTNITPGIGTSRPYEYFGAPFIVPGTLDSPPSPEGVMMRPCTFKPAAGLYRGEKCSGYQIILEPGTEYHSLLHIVQLIRYFKDRYSQFALKDDFFSKLADPVIAEYIKGGITFDIVQEHVKLEEQKWIRKAKRYVLYDGQ
ncbi:MAG: DUF1343 domain-containing protein, partial [Bacteroidales bacterium]|nr:DUF1343 domain-containing protein [Bacteroidales bacterium]